MPRERALAVAFRLLDLGLFRIGGERYAEDNESFGLVTLEKSHVHLERGRLLFDFSAKSGNRHRVSVTDDHLQQPVRALRRRRGGSDRLLAFKDGARWRDLSTQEVNAYLKRLLGDDASAKDFRTWHGTVLAAVLLSRRSDASSRTARSSYVDPRVVERFEEGVTLTSVAQRVPDGNTPPFSPKVERAVVRMLSDQRSG